MTIEFINLLYNFIGNVVFFIWRLYNNNSFGLFDSKVLFKIKNTDWYLFKCLS